MSKMITTTVLKPHLGPNGIIVQVGDTIEIDENRRRQLAKKGYVPRLEGDETEPTKTRTPGTLTNADVAQRRSKIVETAKSSTTPEGKSN